MKHSLLATPAARAELDYRELPMRARTAWGDWLDELNWDHFVTLTFRHPVSSQTACRRFRSWEQRVARQAQADLGWFYVVERGAGGVHHVHGLVDGSAVAGSQLLRSAWSYGYSDARVYEQSRGAAHYVTKEIIRAVDSYDLKLRS